MTVRIKDRGDQNDRIAKLRLDRLALGRSQVIEGWQGSVHTARLGPVNPVIKPGYDRHSGLGRGVGGWIRKTDMGRLDFVQTGLVFGRGDDDKKDWPALMAETDGLDLHPR